MFENSSRKMLVGLISGTLFSTTVALAAVNDETYYLMDSEGKPVMTKQPDCVLTPKTPNTPIKLFEICGDVIDKDRDGVPDDEDMCPNNSPEEVANGVVQYGSKKGCPVDNDKDGVPDYRDDCPTQSEGIDARGCPQDTDKDEVLDYRDDCPNNTRLEISQGVDLRGCPRDTDEDRVVDYKDDCPGTRFGVEVDERGCAIPVIPVDKAPPPPPVRDFSDRVLFDYDMAVLTYRARTTLDGMISQAGGVESIEYVNIVGHADDRGAEEYNQRLSEKRATSVANYLIGQGLSADRITQRGEGENYPVFSNETDEDRTQNRRAEMTVTSF